MPISTWSLVGAAESARRNKRYEARTNTAATKKAYSPTFKRGEDISKKKKRDENQMYGSRQAKRVLLHDCDNAFAGKASAPIRNELPVTSTNPPHPAKVAIKKPFPDGKGFFDE